MVEISPAAHCAQNLRYGLKLLVVDRAQEGLTKPAKLVLLGSESERLHAAVLCADRVHRQQTLFAVFLGKRKQTVGRRQCRLRSKFAK